LQWFTPAAKMRCAAAPNASLAIQTNSRQEALYAKTCLSLALDAGFFFK
jgi:hypothetical protein